MSLPNPTSFTKKAAACTGPCPVKKEDPRGSSKTHEGPKNPHLPLLQFYLQQYVT